MVRRGAVIAPHLTRVIKSEAGSGVLPKKNDDIRIRFAYHGCTNRPFFHIVVMNRLTYRQSQPTEQLGTFEPMPNKDNQKLLSLNIERTRYWMGRGATFSRPVAELMGLIGFLPIHPETTLRAWRDRYTAEEKEKERLAKLAQENISKASAATPSPSESDASKTS